MSWKRSSLFSKECARNTREFHGAGTGNSWSTGLLAMPKCVFCIQNWRTKDEFDLSTSKQLIISYVCLIWNRRWWWFMFSPLWPHISSNLHSSHILRAMNLFLIYRIYETIQQKEEKRNCEQYFSELLT